LELAQFIFWAIKQKIISEVLATLSNLVKHRFLVYEDMAFSVAHENGNEFLTLGEILNHRFVESEKVVFGPSYVQKMHVDHSKLPFKNLSQVEFLYGSEE
jgi:hypothetical protein